MQDTYSANGPGIVFWIVCLVVAVVEIAAFWKVFEKAGQPGWACLIPIYNIIVILQIAGRPVWWVLLYLLPLVNIVITVIVWMDVARSFGKDTGFGIGLWLLTFIFVPILAWGDAQYQGPAGGQPAM